MRGLLEKRGRLLRDRSRIYRCWQWTSSWKLCMLEVFFFVEEARLSRIAKMCPNWWQHRRPRTCFRSGVLIDVCSPSNRAVNAPRSLNLRILQGPRRFPSSVALARSPLSYRGRFFVVAKLFSARLLFLRSARYSRQNRARIASCSQANHHMQLVLAAILIGMAL